MQKAEEKKRKLEQAAAKKRKKQRLAKRKAQAARKAREEKEHADAVEAKLEQDRVTISIIEAEIKDKIIDAWIRPMTSKEGLECLIRVKLNSSGNVMHVEVTKTSGDKMFDDSAERAVEKADPLPVPDDRALFRRKFKAFTFKFNPD